MLFCRKETKVKVKKKYSRENEMKNTKENFLKKLDRKNKELKMKIN